MSKKKHAASEASIENVENALSKTERYIEENQKSLTIILLAIVVVVGGYIGYRKLYLQPLQEEALSQMYMAEYYFSIDSFDLALNGDGSNLGFIDIIDDYKMTKTGNLASYYAGISYLHMGEYEEAIDYLKKFDANDKLVSSIGYGAIGDAHVELGNHGKAVTFFIKAADQDENDFTAPLYLKKAALVYEHLGEYKKALDLYEKINNDYPRSDIARDIEKYIAAMKMKI